MKIRPAQLGSEQVTTRVVLAASFSKRPASSSAALACSAASAALAPLTAVSSLARHPAWQLSGLPDDKAPRSTFEALALNAETVLALRTQGSYGVLTHAWQGAAPPSWAM